jgi:heat shock protein HslJ
VTGEIIAAPTEANVLTGQVWAWQSLEMSDGSVTAVKNPEQYTAEFMDDGTLNLRADCNLGNGAYTEDSGSLTIEAAILTRKACPPGSLSTQFVDRLNEVASYVMDGGKLYLNLKMDSGNMVFAPLAGGEDRVVEATPVPTPEPVVVEPTPAPVAASGHAALIIGPTWEWTGFQDATERYAVAQPSRYTVTFQADGTYQVKADCNTGSGSYTLDGKNLTIGPAAMTRMACPPDSQDTAFLTNLNAAKTQFGAGKSLYIVTDEGGTMKLVRTR